MTLEGEREERRCSPRRRLLVLYEPAAKRGRVLDSPPAVAHPPSILSIQLLICRLCLRSEAARRVLHLRLVITWYTIVSKV